MYCDLSVNINMHETPHGTQRSWTRFACVCFQVWLAKTNLPADDERTRYTLWRWTNEKWSDRFCEVKWCDTLLQDEWTDCISSPSMQTLQECKLARKEPIPTTADLKKLNASASEAISFLKAITWLPEHARPNLRKGLYQSSMTWKAESSI